MINANNKIPLIAAASAIFLSACGGSSSAPPATNSEATAETSQASENTVDARAWTKIPDKHGFDLGAYEKDGIVYTATHSTRDGVNFESYKTPSMDAAPDYRLLSYIDENNKFYLFAGLSFSEIVDTDEWVFYDWSLFGNIRYISGTSDYLISASYQPGGRTLGPSLRDNVEYTEGNALSWRDVVLPNGDLIVTNGVARPADNKQGTILLTDTLIGGWITTDGGRTWSSVLEDMGYLHLTVGSDDYANEFYAFSESAARFSNDSGATWTEITVPDFETDIWVAGTIDSSNGDVLIWGPEGPDGIDKVFKSSDNGNTWTELGASPPAGSCYTCDVPDLMVNEYGYFISADELYFLSK